MGEARCTHKVRRRGGSGWTAFACLSWMLLLAVLVACTQPAPIPTATVTTNRTPGGIVNPLGTLLSASATAPPQLPAIGETIIPTLTPQPISLPPFDMSRLRGLTVRFWHAWLGPARQAVERLVEKFNQENIWGIQVEIVNQPTWDELYAGVEALVGTDRGINDAPDLLVAYPHQLLAWEPRGWLVDQTPYLADAAWGLTVDEQADFYPALWAPFVVHGRRLGIPVQSSAQVLFYNQTWANELDFAAPPVTSEQFQLQACAATRANRSDEDPDNDQTGGWVVSTQPAAVLGWIYAFGGQVVRQNTGAGTVGSPYIFDTSATRAAFTSLRSLYDRGCAWLSENQPPLAEFATRKALFITSSVADIPYMNQAFQQANNRDEWTIISYPLSGGAVSLPIYGPALAILHSTEERQWASWLFLRWFSGGQNLAALTSATGGLPVRAAALNYLLADNQIAAQWRAAAALLPQAHAEPSYASWGLVRWAVSDAATQLFRSYFTIDQVPQLVQLLDETAADLHLDPSASRYMQLPTPLPTSSTQTPLPTTARATPTEAVSLNKDGILHFILEAVAVFLPQR